MADIELSTAPSETSLDPANDYTWIVDVSETPDAINKVTLAILFGTLLTAIRALTDPGADSYLKWNDTSNAPEWSPTSGLGGGSGVGTSTDNAAARFDGTTGTLQNSALTINDTGNIDITGRDFSIKSNNNNIVLDPGAGAAGCIGQYFTGGSDLEIHWSDSSGTMGGLKDAGIKRGGVNQVKITDGAGNAGALLLQEMTAPSAPSANNCVLFSQDNGSGKTQLCVRFPTGAVQVISTEP